MVYHNQTHKIFLTEIMTKLNCFLSFVINSSLYNTSMVFWAKKNSFLSDYNIILGLIIIFFFLRSTSQIMSIPAYCITPVNSKYKVVHILLHCCGLNSPCQAGLQNEFFKWENNWFYHWYSPQGSRKCVSGVLSVSEKSSFVVKLRFKATQKKLILSSQLENLTNLSFELAILYMVSCSVHMLSYFIG